MFPAREGFEEDVLLRTETRPPADVAQIRHACDVIAEEKGSTGSGLESAQESVDGGGLARSVVTKQTRDLTCGRRGRGSREEG